HLLARQAGQGEIGTDPAAQLRQRASEGDDAVELVGVAQRAPVRVVAVLLAAARIASGGLQVATRRRADPDLAIGRRDRQRADARQRVRIAHAAAVGIEVAEAAPAAHAADAWRGIADITQARFD